MARRESPSAAPTDRGLGLARLRFACYVADPHQLTVAGQSPVKRGMWRGFRSSLAVVHPKFAGHWPRQLRRGLWGA